MELIFKNTENQLIHRFSKIFPPWTILIDLKAAFGHGWDSEGQFSMEVLDFQSNGGDLGGGRNRCLSIHVHVYKIVQVKVNI